MIDPTARARIAERLAVIEKAHGVEVLFAAESGSRAWGFASADSDYDVRFVYRHPAAWYLSLAERRDVIEYPLDAHGLDVAGWDLRKALRLLLRSNPPLHEWLVSPIVYLDREGFGAAMRALFERHAVPCRLAHHYLSMARGQRDLLGSRPLVRRKRYLYVARPLLAARLLRHRIWPPPMATGRLRYCVRTRHQSGGGVCGRSRHYHRHDVSEEIETLLMTSFAAVCRMQSQNECVNVGQVPVP